MVFNAESKYNRWKGIERGYDSDEVERLRGSVKIEYTLARMGAEKLWLALHENEFVHALGALTGNQAVQQVSAGLEAIYVSGWQVAADANLASSMYPDQSLYPCNSVPTLIEKINKSLLRADQVHYAEEGRTIDWMAPIVADAEAGFGGPLNAYELTKAMIEAGTAAIHFEDQLSSAKKCGHMGGKVLVPTCEFLTKLKAARLATDVCDVPTIIIARTDANDATLLTSDVDEVDKPFIIPGERTVEGFFRLKNGLDLAIARGLSYAPYADMIWCETSKPDLEEAKKFAEGIHAKYPNKMLCYNCSPSFNWKGALDDKTIARFQRELAAMGYKFQFITLAGFHSLNHGMYTLAKDYHQRDMLAYSELQEKEFESADDGYEATTHQKFVGAGYFDQIMRAISNGQSEVEALKNSTEEAQFGKANDSKVS